MLGHGPVNSAPDRPSRRGDAAEWGAGDRGAKCCVTLIAKAHSGLAKDKEPVEGPPTRAVRAEVQKILLVSVSPAESLPVPFEKEPMKSPSPPMTREPI